jgi:signal transduction histidine kinase
MVLVGSTSSMQSMRHRKITFGLDTSQLIWLAIVGISYAASAKAGFYLAFANQQVTAVWPPTGIALAALLLGGRRMWPAIFLGAFSVNALSNEPVLTAIGIAVGNTAGPMLGAFLLQRATGFDPQLSRLSDVWSLAFLGCAVAMIVTATNGVINLALAGIIPWRDAYSVWWVWWLGDTMGALLVAPVILTWFLRGVPELRGSRLVELLATVCAAGTVAVIVFSNSLPLAYPIFPFVMWIALRFEQRDAATVVLLVSMVAVWKTVDGQGPFAEGAQDWRLSMLVSFMAVLSLTVLSLGALASERRRSEGKLRDANNELEARVLERTAALGQANATLVETNLQLARRTTELARKNEEVEAFVYIVSHDLRAPLVNLQGFSRELKLSLGDLEATIGKQSLSAEAVQSIQSVLKIGVGTALRYIENNVSKFERLIDALLFLSRTGQQQYKFEALDVRMLVTSTVDSLRQTISSKDADLIIGDLPNARGDVTAVEQVFSNLIGNALKYLRPDRRGVITVAGRGEGPFIHYWVADNGAGIPEQAKPRLFQIFQRFHPELAAGDGIGLAAVKRIVERHGGTVWVESENEAGSAFHFTLLAMSEAKEAA